MTQTLTTDRQQFEEWWHEEYCHLEGSSEAAFVKHVAWEAMQKARELLANRAAQPVVYLKKSIIDSERFDSADPEIILHPNTPEGWHSEYQAVFTAPPAPAVPEALANDIDSDDHPLLWSHNNGWNACRAAMLAQPVSQGKLPDNVREALTLALQAMEFMGDTLNNIDAVCTEDVEYVTPAFSAVRGLLAAAPDSN